jgi:hypothetical protein
MHPLQTIFCQLCKDCDFDIVLLLKCLRYCAQVVILHVSWPVLHVNNESVRCAEKRALSAESSAFWLILLRKERKAYVHLPMYAPNKFRIN